MPASKEKCPVCGDPMGGDAQSVNVSGKKVRVCCDDCAKQVKADPKKYAGGRP